MVKKLVESGANINAKPTNGNSPMIYACLSGRKDIFEVLIENGANILAINCLHLVSVKGNVEIMKILLEKGLDVNSRNGKGDTPLLITCLNGQAKAAHFLLKNGANFQAVNKHLYNGLHIVAEYDGMYASLLETAKVLLEEGADATMKTHQGLTPFHLAVRKPNLPFLKVLYDFRPTFDVKDHANNNTIEFVLTKKQQDAMRMIIFHFHQ